MLTDARWEKLFHLMKSTGRVYDKPEHRQTFEGILYRLRTGIPWRDLPKEFGHWSTVFRRFHLWSVLVNPNWTLLLENSQTLQVTDCH